LWYLSGGAKIYHAQYDEQIDISLQAFSTGMKQTFGQRCCEFLQTAENNHRYAGAQSETGREQRFWLALLHAATAGYVSALAAVYIYTLATWGEPNRGWITLVASSALVFSSGFVVFRHQIVTMRHRLAYLVFADIFAGLCVLVIGALDGGSDSPVACLLILPVVFLAIGYPRPAVVFCGLVFIVGATLLWLISSDTTTPTTAMFNLVSLVIALLLAVIGSTARDREKADLSALRQRLEMLASTDDLTGCLNQRAFTEALSREIEDTADTGRPLSLLVIDIDHFKKINDHHGHVDGDSVLRKLGSLLQVMVGDNGVAGRPGGDEFAVLRRHCCLADGVALAERIRQAFSGDADPVRATLSIGVASVDSSSLDAAAFFRRADRALYAAKRQGRDRVSAHAD